MIVQIVPTDVVGADPTTEEWLLAHGIVAQLVHKIIVDTTMRCATIYQAEGRVEADIVTKEPTVIIHGKPGGDPVLREPYTIPIKDLPPKLEAALRHNIKSIEPLIRTLPR